MRNSAFIFYVHIYFLCMFQSPRACAPRARTLAAETDTVGRSSITAWKARQTESSVVTLITALMHKIQRIQLPSVLACDGKK